MGTRLLVAPPEYSGLTAVVDVSARSLFDPDEVRDDVLRALYELFHPLIGGPDRTGWPFGRSVQSHEVHAALARIPGVDMAQEISVSLFPADATSGRRSAPVQRLDLPATALVFSYEHQVRVHPMRGPLDDLRSAHPLGTTLPAVYREDAFTQRLCQALDAVLAPVLSTLDNLPAYLDLGTEPQDLLPWLAHWLGLAADPGHDPVRQRELLRSTSDLQGWQGTRRGIELAVGTLLGVRAQVVESGGAAWSVAPSDPLPGEATSALVVRVFPEPGRELDPERLEAVVAAIKPAHVVHRVQVVQS